jgi:hypothetical protein
LLREFEEFERKEAMSNCNSSSKSTNWENWAKMMLEFSIWGKMSEGMMAMKSLHIGMSKATFCAKLPN